MVKDTFAQCDGCKMWDRLFPTDEEDMRGIPLRGVIDPKTKLTVKYVCDGCHDEIENKCYGADLERSLTDSAFDTMFLKEVKKIKERN